MSRVGIEAIAINSSTRDEASRLREEELWVTARTHGNVIVAGPEQLKSKEFEKSVLSNEFWVRTCGLGFDEVHLLNIWGPRFRKDFLQMGFVKARLNDDHCPWILTSATIRDGIPLNNICSLLGLRSTPLHIIRRSNYRPEIQLLFRELTSSIDGDMFPELDWVITSDRSTLIFAKTISLGSRIHSYLYRKSPPGSRDQNIRLYNSLNWDSYNAETRKLLAGIPGSNLFCRIGIGTDTLSVGVDMPAIQDGLIIGDVEDSDEAFQKWGRLGRLKSLGFSSRGIVYTTASAIESAKQALAAAEVEAQAGAAALAAGGKPKTHALETVDLSWPTMLCAKCKTKAQYELYNQGVIDEPCTCTACTTDPLQPFDPDGPCNCSGCVPENISPLVKPPPPPTILSIIPPADRISAVARAHGEVVLAGFRKDVWRADKANYIFGPEIYMPDKLIKEVLDRWSQLDSPAAVTRFLAPYPRLCSFDGQLFDLMEVMQVEFDRLDAEKKAEMAAKRKAKRMSNIDGNAAAKGDESGEGSGVSDGTPEASDKGSDAENEPVQPSHSKV
jgi:hypothetical protein